MSKKEDKKPEHFTEDLSFDRTHPNAPAMFLPSMSRNYVQYASSYATRMKPERSPKGISPDGRELNVFQPDNGCYYYPYGLTSAGNANLEFHHDKVMEREGIFRTRNKAESVIIADSGGYQIGKGLLEFDWADFEGEKNNKLRLEILRWMESIADLSMTLDVPVWAVGRGLAGIDSFESCLEKTLINHDFFLKHRVPGATRLMNILHGRNEDEGDFWYNAVKDLPFEGWAFAGVNMSNFEFILRRLIMMRDEGYLEKEQNWIHFLGVSRLSSACAFSAIQRNLRKHVEPGFTISYDASSPFFSIAKGRIYTRLTYSPKNLNYTMDQVVDNKDLAGSDLPFPLRTPIGRRLNMGDLCLKGHDIDSKSSWDSWSYMFMMNHNMYMHTKGIQEVNTFYQLPRPHVAHFIPEDLLEFRDLVDEVFTTAKPMDLIEKHRNLLTDLSGIKNSKKGLDAFNTSGFFQEEGTNPVLDVTDFDGHLMDETALDKLISEE